MRYEVSENFARHPGAVPMSQEVLGGLIKHNNDDNEGTLRLSVTQLRSPFLSYLAEAQVDEMLVGEVPTTRHEPEPGYEPPSSR